MKKWLIIIGSFMLLVFLGIRGIYLATHRIDDEKHWYVDNLNLHCTLQVDSVEVVSGENGFIVCHLISGRLDRQVEDSLNKELSHFKRLRFIRSRLNDQYDLYTRRASNYLPGDSLRIDSKQDSVVFFRKGETTVKVRVSNFLREKLF
ncbi:MAG TPA: hypothetical protein VL728_19960 [Cyclobacteriaceae bacterium]|jgi:hypothetical protein|nr:hypothetical protein [Cyclobacteriaceae bacterium]